jgi:hypothetical protein
MDLGRVAIVKAYFRALSQASKTASEAYRVSGDALHEANSDVIYKVSETIIACMEESVQSVNEQAIEVAVTSIKMGLAAYAAYPADERWVNLLEVIDSAMNAYYDLIRDLHALVGDEYYYPSREMHSVIIHAIDVLLAAETNDRELLVRRASQLLDASGGLLDD